MPTPESYDACDKTTVKNHYYGKEKACKKHVECNNMCSSNLKSGSNDEKRCKKRCERIHTGTGQGDAKEEKKRDRAYAKAQKAQEKKIKLEIRGKKKTDKQMNVLNAMRNESVIKRRLN